MALRIGLLRCSALQNDGLDLPVILQCRTHRETNPKGHWGPNCFFEKIRVLFSSLVVLVCLGSLSLSRSSLRMHLPRAIRTTLPSNNFTLDRHAVIRKLQSEATWGHIVMSRPNPQSRAPLTPPPLAAGKKYDDSEVKKRESQPMGADICR